MPVDPELVELLQRAAEAPPLSSQTPERARELFVALAQYAESLAEPVQVAAVEDIQVPGPGGPLAARIYRPVADGGRPTLAFFHGGGFTIGDIAAYDLVCRTLCAKVEAVVVSSDYRLAPEHPFPAAVEDALATTRWVGEHVRELGGDAARLAVGGDSAGGNLAAVVAQQVRGGGPTLAAQLLVYPATDLWSERPSHQENAHGYFLTREDMLWFHGNYLTGDIDIHDARVSPLMCPDLSGLPPAIVATAEYDPLRDDGDAYAQALARAGVRVIHRRFDSLVHGFLSFGPFSGTARAAISQVCADLKGLLDDG